MFKHTIKTNTKFFLAPDGKCSQNIMLIYSTATEREKNPSTTTLSEI